MDRTQNILYEINVWFEVHLMFERHLIWELKTSRKSEQCANTHHICHLNQFYYHFLLFISNGRKNQFIDIISTYVVKQEFFSWHNSVLFKKIIYTRAMTNTFSWGDCRCSSKGQEGRKKKIVKEFTVKN